MGEVTDPARTPEQPNDLDVLVAHLTECVKPDAVIVADGNADELVATLLAAGWTWDGNVEHVAGKRIRNLVPPPEVAARLAGGGEA